LQDSSVHVGVFVSCVVGGPVQCGVSEAGAFLGTSVSARVFAC
jgi:hypothetical protein